MRIRPLAAGDAPLMLEWMQDPSVLEYLRINPGEKTLRDAQAFIASAGQTEESAHFAIADENDVYLGTVSLKGIDADRGAAEFAIVLRKDAQGKGVGSFAACAILEYAFLERGLNSVWLDVVDGHSAGVACYERAGFQYVQTLPESVNVHGKPCTMLRYAITRKQFDPHWRKAFAPPALSQVRRLSFQQMGDERGRLVIAECGREVPFDIKRIFYIYGSDPDVVRGKHANRRSEFVLINVAGASCVRVTDGRETQVFSLDQPHEGLYLPRMLWKEMYDFSPDSVLLVLSNERYDPAEYVRDYDAYLSEVRRFD